MEIFHERIRELKESHNKTQVEIAEALGVTPQTLSYYFNGREPNYELLVKISDLFNVSVDYLVGKSNFKNFDDELQYRNTLGKEQISKAFPQSESILLTINENYTNILKDLSKNNENRYSTHALVAFNQMLGMIQYVKETLKESPSDMEFYIKILNTLKNSDMSLIFQGFENIQIKQTQIDACKRYLNQFLTLYIYAIFDFENMKLKGEK